MAGDGKLLSVNLFGDGQRKGVPFWITLLLMGRNGVMDLRLDTIVCEVLLEFITTRAENGEDVVNAVAIERKAVSLGARGRFSGSDTACYYFVDDVSFIAGGYLLATLIVGIKMTQLDVEDGGLQFVDTRVATQIVVHVFLMTSVIAQGTNDISQFVIVSGHGTSITQCTKILARIERVSCSVAKGARPYVLRFQRSKSMWQNCITPAPVGLGVVLNQFQTVAVADVPYPIRIGATTVEVDYHNGTGTGCDSLLDERIINLQGFSGGFD